MKYINLNLLKPCEGCLGTCYQIQTEGKLKNMIRPCPICFNSYDKFVNQYGTDRDQWGKVWIDQSGKKPIIQKIDPQKDYIVLPDKTIVNLNNNLISSYERY